MRDWHKWLKENLRQDQIERLDAYDVQILASIESRMKRLDERRLNKHKPLNELKVGTEGIYRDVHAEMGGITEEEFDVRLRKLSDMAVVRIYITFNRDMGNGEGQ